MDFEIIGSGTGYNNFVQRGLTLSGVGGLLKTPTTAVSHEHY